MEKILSAEQYQRRQKFKRVAKNPLLPAAGALIILFAAASEFEEPAPQMSEEYQPKTEQPVLAQN